MTRLLLVVAALLLAALTPVAYAQTDYPSKPVRIVVGFPPGTVADVTARLLAQKMAPGLGQQLIVDNKPGASSNIAAELVVRSPKDGYTLLMATVANVINTSLFHNLSFDFATDLAPVMLIGSVPALLVVNPSLPVHDVAELIALAKAKPGEIFYASSGNGTAAHLSGELFNLMAGVKLSHIPYKGSSEVLNDLIAGRVTVAFANASTVLPHVQAGTLRALASTGLARTAVAPNLPTISESGLQGFDTAVWMGVLAPAGTPPEVIARLASAFGDALNAGEVKAQLATQGIDTIAKGPQDFASYVRSETAKWAKAVEISGAKVD
jgi:tripartite-type tricarboxylate transporter receptor subunit TctC